MLLCAQCPTGSKELSLSASDISKVRPPSYHVNWISVDKDLKDCTELSSDLYAHLLWALSWQLLQGVDGAKLELQEVVDFLKNPDKYTALGAKIPKVSLLFLGHDATVGSPCSSHLRHGLAEQCSSTRRPVRALPSGGIKLREFEVLTWRAWL